MQSKNLRSKIILLGWLDWYIIRIQPGHQAFMFCFQFFLINTIFQSEKHPRWLPTYFHFSEWLYLQYITIMRSSVEAVPKEGKETIQFNKKVELVSMGDCQGSNGCTRILYTINVLPACLNSICKCLTTAHIKWTSGANLQARKTTARGGGGVGRRPLLWHSVHR